MTWDYRIIKHDTVKSGHFAIHEVYYDDKGNVEAWTEEPIEIIGSSKSEIVKDMEYIISDIKQPILNESELLQKLKTKKRKQLKKHAR
jgi:hypothetical protein